MDIQISEIKIGDNRRKVSGDKVRELADSIKEIGLLNPVAVTADKILISGAHRIEAFRLLGFDRIPASIIQVDGMRAELAEIDENLVRNDLHYTERGDYLRRRKEIFEAMYPETRHGGDRKSENIKMRNPQLDQKPFVDETSSKTGVSSRVIHEEIQIAESLPPEVKEIVRNHDVPKIDALKLARMEPEKQKAVASQIATGAMDTASAIREINRKQIVTRLEDTAAKEAKAIAGVYDVIVIDPPWPMQKIERDERPNQSEFDYPVMTEEEIKAVKIPAADDCHLWLWTTHKFLPMAFRCLEAWDFKYVCTFVWHKPGGFQPFGLPQYNCEFVLYARKGAPSFIDTKAFCTCFDAPRGAHSEKPEAFYGVVRRVTAGRAVDMFNRRGISGFDGWGKEAIG